jgi:hypothetical protein
MTMAIRTVGPLLLLFVILSHGTACSAGRSAGSQSIAGTPSSSASQIKITADAKQREARETVEKYWSSAPQDRYALLAENYKRSLRRVGIADATAYAKETQNPERVWGARTYQKVDVSHDGRQNRDVAQVVVLVEWEQEGYRGVMTYIFELIVEDPRWKISFIMH